MLTTLKHIAYAFRDSRAIPFLLKRWKRLPKPIIETMILAELGRLYAGMLHDLSTPLTALMMYVRTHAHHDTMIEEVTDTIKKLLHIARNIESTTTYSAVSIDELIHNARGLFAQRLQCAGVRIHAYIEQPLYIYGKKLALQQIINNVVSNAIDAYTNSTSTENTITITATQTKHHVRISVHDTGCGITPEQLKHIFKNGYTTKTYGHGFGLSLTYQLVRFECRGSIQLTSTKEAGTYCTITLPKNCHRSVYPQMKSQDRMY